MKKLLFLINGLANSGSEQSLVNFLNCLDYEKYKATVLVLKGPDDLAENITPKAEIKYLYKDNPYFDSPKGIKLAFSHREYRLILPIILCNILKKSKTKLLCHTVTSIRKRNIAPQETFDMCIAYEYVTMKYMTERIKAKKKTVRHNYGEILPKKKDRLLFEKCDYVVALTPILKERLAETFRIPKEKIHIIPSNFDKKEIKRKSQEPIPPFRTALNFVSVGRITELKRQDLIIRAMKILKDRGYRDFACRFVGGCVSNKDNETYFAGLKKMTEDMGLTENIIFTGETPNPFPYIKNSQIYLQASDFEAASRSVIEALVLGKPCLSTDTVGGKALIIPGENGELTPVGDAEKFGEKLIYMINNLSRYAETDTIPDNEEIMEKWYSLFD